MPPVITDELYTRIVRELGLANAPEAQQEAAVAALGENIVARILAAAMERLDADGRAELEQLAGAGEPVKLFDFLSSRIPDIQHLIASEARTELAETKKLLA